MVEARTIAETKPLIFEDAVIWPDSSLFARDQIAFAPDPAIEHLESISWQNGNSCAFDTAKEIALRRLPKVRIKKGICAFGHGATNWYHWLIEILPAIMLSQRLGADYDDLPFLVPRHILENESFRDSFEVFRGSRSVVPLELGRCYQVREMVVIPSPVFGPFNMATGHWPRPNQYLQNVAVLKHFRTKILEQNDLLNEPESNPKHVFLSRPTDKRSYNQQELEDIAKHEGFSIVRPETLSFNEQVRLWAQADIVVGATGAAWACSLFMKPGSKALIWAASEFSGGCFFSNLALISGSDVYYQFTKSDTELRSTTDAHQRGYVIPPDDFLKNLRSLLRK